LDDSVSLNSPFAIKDEADDVLSFGVDQKLSRNESQESTNKIDCTSDSSNSISECSDPLELGEIRNPPVYEKQEDTQATW
jgi:hypothetical protein